MSNERGDLVPRGQVVALSPERLAPVDRGALKRDVRSPARLGLLLILAFVVGFGAWATLVPLAGGAIAAGTISPDGSRRTVQHLEGGIVRKLHVRDGDAVEAGAPLLVLESVQAQASHDLHLKKHRALTILKARLQAERSGADDISDPAGLHGDGPEIRAAMETQREIFQVRRAAHQTSIRVLRQRKSQLRAQIRGLEAQVAAVSRQMDLIAEEVAGKRKLQDLGYLPKPELLRMMRMEAELAGQKGRFLASISEAEQQIGETELQLIANETERANQIVSQLDQVQTEIDALHEKLISSQDVLSRTVVTAPVAGTVVDLRSKTEGGVVQPGAPILDIVPSHEKLVIDARVSPMDIDVVRKGLKAQVQLSVFPSRSAPRIDGRVVAVSADRLVDEATGQAYYLARVEVDRDLNGQVEGEFELMAGMPADVLIVTGNRTMAAYLLQPFLDAVWRTLRET